MSTIAARLLPSLAKATPPRSVLLGSTLTKRSIPSLSSATRQINTTKHLKMPATEYDKPVAVIDASVIPRLPAQSVSLFQAKKAKRLTFEEISAAIGRDEVACAAIFYGQAQASEADVAALAKLLDLPHEALAEQMYGLPDRGRTIEMPPKEPLIYRLYEIVQNYGYAYKAVLNEKFGDGIMSAISFSTKVEKETDEKGDWVKITLRGKWLPYTRF